MKFKEEYTKFNDFYYEKLKGIYDRAKMEPNGNVMEFC